MLAVGKKAITDQTHIGLMYQASGVKGVTRGFDGHFRSSQLSQFVVDERQQVGGGLTVATGSGFDHSGNVGHSASVTVTAGRGMGNLSRRTLPKNPLRAPGTSTDVTNVDCATCSGP